MSLKRNQHETSFYPSLIIWHNMWMTFKCKNPPAPCVSTPVVDAQT